MIEAPPLPPVTSVVSVTSESNNTTQVTGGDPRARARAREEPAGLLDGLRNGAWLNEQKFPDLRWAVRGLIPEGVTLLVGPPKAGKSWLITGCLLSIAAGGRALGAIQCDPGRRALNMAFEDGDRRQQSRCRELMEGDPIPERYDYLTRLSAPGTVMPTIGAYLEQNDNVGMIVVDTLGKVMPDARSGETTYSRDYRVGSALKAAADSQPGLAVVAVHHDRKAMTDDFVESVSGTNGLAGAVDTLIVFRRKRQSDEGILHVTGRDVIEAEYAIKQRGGAWLLDGRTLAEAAKRAKQRQETDDLGEISRKILDYFRERPEGCRAAEVTEQFGPGARTYLARLLKAGRLDKVKRGLYVLPADPELEDAA